MATTTIKTSFSATDSLMTELALRSDNRSFVINRDLERLYALYRRAVSEASLTVEEACLLVDMLNGIIADINTARLLWAEIEDACNLDKLDEKWGVDKKNLIRKVKNFSDVQCLALIDAAERFWNASERHQDIKEVVKEYFNII